MTTMGDCYGIIYIPLIDDATAVSRAHLTAWLQTYPNEYAGVDEAWITENVGSVVTTEGITRWRNVIGDAWHDPDRFFCRVVRTEAGIGGFMCGRRDEVVNLGPMYLLDGVKGHGVGGRLMREFFSWTGDVPARLWVTSYNTRAIRFYARYGFKMTDERELWRGKLPNVRMVRDPFGAATAGQYIGGLSKMRSEDHPARQT